MKKNLLNEEAAGKMIARVQMLRPDSPALWGTMTATEMLLHCNQIHERLLSPATTTAKKASLKQYAIRWVVLYVMPRFPKGVKAPKQVRTKGAISDAEFEKQQALFAAIVQRFPLHTSPINHPHPYFGNLNSKQWGLAAWKHLDHHLRQFGV